MEKKSHDHYLIKADRKPFRGDVYLLTDASNSSSTHYLAKTLREYKLATLVGEETGGNLKGMNGGQMFFVLLPHSQIEFDIPIYGSAEDPTAKNQGVKPDHEVQLRPADIAQGLDPYLEKVEHLIEAK